MMPWGAAPDDIARKPQMLTQAFRPVEVVLVEIINLKKIGRMLKCRRAFRIVKSPVDQLHEMDKLVPERSAMEQFGPIKFLAEIDGDMLGYEACVDILPVIDSSRTAAIVDQLLKSTDRFTRMQLYYTDGRARAEREHAKIVRLCAVGKHAEAARTLREHIENAGEQLVELLRAHQPLFVREAS